MDQDISPHAKIGRNVTLGHGVRIYDHVEIGDHSCIGDFCALGLPVSHGPHAGQPLVIGARSVIRSHSILYEGSVFGDRFETGHHVVTREGVQAGVNLRVGSYCSLEGVQSFGDYCRMHGHVQVGRHCTIGHFVWIFAQSLLVTDPLPPSTLEEEVIVEDGAVLCVNATVYPGVRIGKAGFVSANTTVKRDVPPCTVVVGADGKQAGRVDLLIDRKSGRRHPWYSHFAEAYPEDAQPRLKELLDFVRTHKKKP